jgi:hypothetical protein
LVGDGVYKFVRTKWFKRPGGKGLKGPLTPLHYVHFPISLSSWVTFHPRWLENNAEKLWSGRENVFDVSLSSFILYLLPLSSYAFFSQKNGEKIGNEKILCHRGRWKKKKKRK